MPLSRIFAFLLPLCCVWLAAIRTFAATPDSDSPFIVDSWTAENGLPDNEGVSLLQSKSGYLWIGTLHGLVRFDGNRFTNFDEMNTPGLQSDRIVFLYEDRQTNLWIGTQSEGLAVIQNGKITNFEKETAGAGKVTAASETGNDVSFYSEFGFAQYHDGRMSYYPGVRSLQLYFLEQHLTVPARDGGEWELFRGRVQKSMNGQIEKDFGPWPWGNAVVNAACEDENGNLIVGTPGKGIFWFDADGHYRRISTADGLSSDSILSLCFDSEGDLWVGTDSGGINRVKRKMFNNVPGLHPWNVRSVALDATGGLWAAFNPAGISYWNSNGVRDFHLGQISSASPVLLDSRKNSAIVEALFSAGALSVLVDSRKNTWAGSSSDGLFLFQSDKFIRAPEAGNLGKEISALFESHDGTLWAGSEKGLGRRDENGWKLFTTADGLSGNAVSAIAEDHAGTLWIGTQDSGLNSFDGKKFTSFGTTNGLPGDDISCLYVDRDGTLWAGTSAHGLARLENGKWKCFSTRDGLASDSIGYIIGDGDGYLWIGSNRGLMRIALKSFDEPAPILCRVYGRADGLPTRECSSGSQPSAIRSNDGKLWFPTIDGLVWTDPSNIKPDLRPPQVLIESAQIDGQEQNTNPLNSAWDSSVTIPPGNEQLDIHFTALNFSSPQAMRFRYRLEGHETGWTEASDRVAHYADLSPGHYRFNVIACNKDGNWDGTGAFLDVTVLPQFWQTKPFLITTILLALGAIVGTVRYLSTQKLHRQVQLMKQREALEHERARIARDLHDQLGANLTQVALLGEMAEADKHLPDEVEEHSRQISQTARETTRSLDEIVWAVNPSNDTLEGLANYVCKYAQEYLALANLPCRVDVPAQLPAAAIPPEVRHNVFLAFKEAVHNVVKHAHAQEVWVRLALRPKQFLLQVEDNGRGLNAHAVTNRNGLRNMKKRMEDIGGDFSVSAGAKGGTLVQLTAPLRNSS